MWSKSTEKMICSIQLSAYYSSSSLKQSSLENIKDNTKDNITIWAHNLTRYQSGYFQCVRIHPFVVEPDQAAVEDPFCCLHGRWHVCPPWWCHASQSQLHPAGGREDREHMVERVRPHWPQGTHSLPLEAPPRVSQKYTRVSLSSTVQSLLWNQMPKKHNVHSEMKTSYIFNTC